MSTLLSVDKVRQDFSHNGKHQPVLEDVALTLDEGEIVGLLGRSGSGKSTLLRIIAGLMPPTGGQVTYRNVPVQGPAEGIAMVFQSFALFPWLTVLQNVEIGLDALGVAQKETRRRALEAIDLIGLDGYESAYPRELSGGMRQRVGFARALVVNPDILLMDEPFSALDVLTAETLRTDFLELWSEKKLPIKSVLLVTHNIEEAVLMCDRLLIFAANPGRVAQSITLALPHPRNRQDAEFRATVDNIYNLMTARPVERGAAPAPSVSIGGYLHSVSTNVLSGMIEELASPTYGGRADLPHLADQLTMAVDELLPVAETLDLLGFAVLAEGDIGLTPGGRLFAEQDTQGRKGLFAAHLLQRVPLAAHIRRVLDERPNHRAPRLRFETELGDYLPDENAAETLGAVIRWGRYAELFSYDDSSEMFSLENPEAEE